MNEGRRNVVFVQGAESNGLGIAGFVLSLLGLVSCGLFGPLGFLVSLFGLAYRPRGLAVAGLVLGGLTTGIFAFFGFALLSTMFAAITGIQIAANEASNSLRMTASNMRVINEFKEFGAIPSTTKGKDLVNADREGSQPFTGYQRVDEFRYKLTVAGPDGELGTEDDRTESFDIRKEVPDYQEIMELLAWEKEQENNTPPTTSKPMNEPDTSHADPPAVTATPMRSPSPSPATMPHRTSSQPIETDLSDASTIEEATRNGVFNLDDMENRKPKPLTGIVEFENENERTWQSLDGNFSTTAILLKFDRDKDEVQLKKTDGSEITVPIKTLSFDDRNYIRGQAREAE